MNEFVGRLFGIDTKIHSIRRLRGKEIQLTRSFVPTSMFTSTESSITELAFVLFLRYQGRLASDCWRCSDGIHGGDWHGGERCYPSRSMVEYRLGSRAKAYGLKCGGFLLVYGCHSFLSYLHRFSVMYIMGWRWRGFLSSLDVDEPRREKRRVGERSDYYEAGIYSFPLTGDKCQTKTTIFDNSDDEGENGMSDR
jgi:hypothetical protein